MGANVPDGWKEVQLGDVATIIMGQSPPGSTVVDWSGQSGDGGLPFVQGNAEFNGKHPRPTKWCTQPAKIAEPGDALISVRAPVGELNLANQRLGIGRGLAAIRFTRIEPTYGWHAIAMAKRALGRLSQGSTFDAIGGDMLRTLSIYVPPEPERRAIAAVLDSIDEAIERTEATIAATEDLRKALLQELLTRGVPGWHTEWKDVPGVGTVPACWDVVKLGDCGRWFSGGTPSKANAAYWRGNIPWISPKDIKVRVIRDSIDHISPDGVNSGSRLMPAQSIFLVIRGMILAHSFPVAMSAVPCAFNQDLKAVECSGAMYPPYLLLVLEQAKQRLLDLVTPSTHGTMRVITEELFNILIPTPEMAEQQRIAKSLGELHDKLEGEFEYLSQLRRAKAAMADALLTGRVRVLPGMKKVGLA